MMFVAVYWVWNGVVYANDAVDEQRVQMVYNDV